MSEKYRTFQKFNDLGLAEEISRRLNSEGVDSIVENNRDFFDPSFSNNTIEANIDLKLKPTDFEKAHKVLSAYYQSLIDLVDNDYYLFGFSDNELIEIITKPDEWGRFDYELARRILKDRGKEITPDVAELLKGQRNEELSKPEVSSRYWLYFGYISSFLGGFFGIIIGWTLAYTKKTLPNGSTAYVYNDNDRNHGTRMLLISCFSLITLFAIKMIYFND